MRTLGCLSNNTSNLDNELDDQCMRNLYNIIQKLFVLWHTKIEKVEIFCGFNDKASLLTRRRPERGTGIRRQIMFKVWA